MTRTTVVVADSLPVFGSGVCKVLERERDFVVVEASTLDELVAVCAGSAPDIALVDLDLPPAGGIAAVRALGRSCTTRSIIWSFETDAETVLEAIRAGACGFLARDLRPDALVRALRGLANGQAPISRVLALSFIDALHRVDEGKDARDRAATLSARELEVLTQVAGGARNREIAVALRISEFTVKRHMHNILEKLDVPSRNAAGAFYRTTFAGQAVPA